MRLPDVRERVARAIDFPADRATVIRQFGDRELEAPEGETESIREILELSGEDSFRSADEFYTTIVGGVSDAYIGRKFYDDRGGNVAPEHRSF